MKRPAAKRAKVGGTVNGALAPSRPAAKGIHSDARAGTSSVTLKTPTGPSSAATVALTASSMCTRPKKPPPAPAIGRTRLAIKVA